MVVEVDEEDQLIFDKLKSPMMMTGEETLNRLAIVNYYSNYY